MLFVTAYQKVSFSEGDIVNVDVTALKDGWHGDTSRMYFHWRCINQSKPVSKTTYEALIKSIKILKNESLVNRFVIQKYVEKSFSVVRDFVDMVLEKNFIT